MADLDSEVLLLLAERLRRGEPVVLATAVATEGAPPCRPGQKLLAGPTGPLAGTLGCSEFDASALADVASVLQGREPSRRHYRHQLGDVFVLLEPFAGKPSLVVVSATPVAAHLLAFARRLGWRTTLAESRGGRVDDETRPNADRVVSNVAELEPGTHDVVLTDHDSPDVDGVLRWALGNAAGGFIGMMGSRRHAGGHLDTLRSAGVAHTERIRTPVGLDIGGVTAAEIALSIAAGLVADRNGRLGGWLDADGRNPVSAAG
ncbi:MAG TPA: XdhC/CoxI family protein [Acidimicrobiales bacterium]|nr:XdhC/CoxI family protein [Acidimicrobiales bacterium]